MATSPPFALKNLRFFREPALVFVDLTPLVPLSFKGEGEEILEEGFHPS
jgi:hypothetical protein